MAVSGLTADAPSRGRDCDTGRADAIGSRDGERNRKGVARLLKHIGGNAREPQGTRSLDL